MAWIKVGGRALNMDNVDYIHQQDRVLAFYKVTGKGHERVHTVQYSSSAEAAAACDEILTALGMANIYIAGEPYTPNYFE